MPLWTIYDPPVWKPDAVATPAGWTDPVTGELLIAIDGLSTWKAGADTAAGLNFTATGRGIGGNTGTTSLLQYIGFLPPSLYQTDPSTPAPTFVTGQVMTLYVQYNIPIFVSGTPHINVTLNGVSRTFNYASSGLAPGLGHGSLPALESQLLFTYTPVAADAALAGEVIVLSPISGGTMQNVVSGGPASTLTFPAQGTAGSPVASNVANVTVNTVAPVIVSTDGIAGTYALASHIFPTTTFSQPVVVTGTPTYPININGTVQHAAYSSGSGTTVLTFSYLVASGDAATAGQFTTGNVLTLAGGTIKNSVGINASLTFTPPSTSSVVVT